MKSAFLIQAMNAFIYGAMSIVIPLLMVDRGIAVESMGLIFAVLPIISQTARITFATLSDFIGRKIFYGVNSVMNLIFMGVYFFARHPLEFIFGKFTEGIRNAALWSVNRAYFMDHSYEKKNILIKMRGVGSIFTAFGTIAAGLLIALVFYENTILICMLLSLFIIPQVFRLKDKMKRKVSIPSIIKSFDLRGRKGIFRNFIIIFIVMGIGWGLIAGYIFPLFLRLLGYSEKSIGLILGARTLCAGLVTYFFASRVSGKRLVLFGGLSFATAVGLLSFASASTVLAILLIGGLADGLVAAGFEYIFVKVVKNSSSAGDIAFLMFGLHMGMSGSLALSGFIISSVGFGVMFLASAVLFGIGSVASYYNLKR
jgi:MFS family permease